MPKITEKRSTIKSRYEQVKEREKSLIYTANKAKEMEMSYGNYVASLYASQVKIDRKN